MPELTYSQAINAAIREEMRRDKSVFLMGEDVAQGFGGGIFGASTGLLDEFGPERVINTPISEVAIAGAAMGAAWAGMRPIAEYQFADFLSIGLDQIQAGAKFRYTSDKGEAGCAMVLRTPFGAGIGAGMSHSQSSEAWVANIPGLTIAMPSTPYDAKGLLKSAIRSNDPVIFFESINLYQGATGHVPDEEYLVPIGKADVKRIGSDVTIIATGAMVPEALAAADQLQSTTGLSAEIVDPRTLLPLDQHTIVESVRKTGKVVIVHEAPVTGGIGGEIAAVIAEHAFEYLKAPIRRVGAPFTPVPSNRRLEHEEYLPTSSRILDVVNRVVLGKG